MKQGTLVIRITILTMFLAIAAYLGVSAWRSFNDPFSTLVTYSHTVDDAAEVTGYLVRQEEVIPGGALSIMDLRPANGEKVAAGSTVAYLYRDEAALERRRQLRTLELEREQLLYSLQSSAVGWDNARLDESIVDSILALKSSAAYGDLTGLEDQALSLKSLILRREHTSGGAAEIQAAVTALDGQIAALRAASDLDTLPISVEHSGVFAAGADGYETLLTPAALEDLSPSGYRALTEQKPTAPTGAVGRLVTGSRWYFAATMPAETADRLVEGWAVWVRFSRDWSGEVAMTVEHISDPEEGQCAVVLSSNRSLADTILLRRQTVEIIFDSVTGIRVPKKAVRSVSVDVVDPETKEVTGQRQATGVFVLVGAQAEFKETRILADDGDYYLLQSVDEGVRSALRAGDVVIVAAVDLYDGKVIQ